MYKGKKILAIITARAGSKGLTAKNIKLLADKPLIVWTIEAAKKSIYIDRVIVSTDDKKIALISKRYRGEVPFLRPANLAQDNSSSIDVVLHAIEWLKKQQSYYDIVVLLQPTSPLRTYQDIDAALKLLFSKKAMAIVSVCQVSHHPYWMNTLLPNGCMKDFIRLAIVHKNRQQLPNFYQVNGAIYLAYCKYIEKKKSFLGKNTFAYIMPRQRSVDIDDVMDFKFAEMIIASKAYSLGTH